jgi:hypothetical protein
MNFPTIDHVHETAQVSIYACSGRVSQKSAGRETENGRNVVLNVAREYRRKKTLLPLRKMLFSEGKKAVFLSIP